MYMHLYLYVVHSTYPEHVLVHTAHKMWGMRGRYSERERERASASAGARALSCNWLMANGSHLCHTKQDNNLYFAPVCCVCAGA